MLKKALKVSISIILVVFLIIICYFLVEYFLSRASNNFELTKEQEYTIFIKSNGVHTDIVLPVKSDIINWNDSFPFEDTLSKSSDFLYIGIGWGDKGFYLDTPTWSQLKVSTAIIATFGLGTTALHTTYYKEILEDGLTYEITISKKQYKSLINSIKKSLQYKDEKPINIKTDAQYGQSDAFYEAIGSYSILHTCNTWTNNLLKEAKLPSGKWVAFDDGILYHYKKIR